MRTTRIVLKVVFILLFGILPAYEIYSSLDSADVRAEMKSKTLTTGVFEVEHFDAPVADSLRWKDVIFEDSRTGSIQTADTLLRQRYRRGYFNYTLDSTKHTIAFNRFMNDSLPLFIMQYTMPDSNHIVLRGKIRDDSTMIALKRQKRRFQLAERQFHWLSESNR